MISWKGLLLAFALGCSFGVYSHIVWQGYLENEADKKHNEWYNKNAVQLEEKRVVNRTNERKVMYAQKNLGSDCFVNAERLLVVNSALTNDTSKLGK